MPWYSVRKTESNSLTGFWVWNLNASVLLSRDVLKFIEQRGLKPAPVAQVATPAPPAAAAPPPPPTATPVAAPPAKKAPPAAAVQTEGGYSDLELTSMRKTIAKRLTESKVCFTFQAVGGGVSCVHTRLRAWVFVYVCEL